MSISTEYLTTYIEKMNWVPVNALTCIWLKELSTSRKCLSIQDHIASQSHTPHENEVMICEPSRGGNASLQACVRLETYHLLYRPHSRESITTLKCRYCPGMASVVSFKPTCGCTISLMHFDLQQKEWTGLSAHAHVQRMCQA